MKRDLFNGIQTHSAESYQALLSGGLEPYKKFLSNTGFYKTLLEEFNRLTREPECRPPLSPKVIVYVHGYNNGYQESIDEIFDLRESLMEHGYEYRPIIIGFSWPASSNIFKYRRDRKKVLASVCAFAKFLGDLKLVFSNPGDLVTMGNSTGCYMLRMGFEEYANTYAHIMATTIASEGGGSTDVFGETLLLSADIVAKDIEKDGKGKDIIEYSRCVHVYYSKYDRVLAWSRWLRTFWLPTAKNRKRLGKNSEKAIDYNNLDPNSVVVINTEEYAKKKSMKAQRIDEKRIRDKKGKKVKAVHLAHRYHPRIIWDIVQVISGIKPASSIAGRTDLDPASGLQNHYKLTTREK